ncbi:MAG: sulfatase [Planctomycetota bacterium]|jgi:arylsulfatase A-like enzyme
MDRRGFLKAVGMGIGALVVPGCVEVFKDVSAKQGKRPNIVFILVDDLGWADLTCYGSSFYETPNIDKLASEGMRFTDAYVACPVCSPTRASIMCGKYPSRIDLTNYLVGKRSGELITADFVRQMALEEETVAEALKEGGYKTGFMGKWHIGVEPQYWPEHQGFDINIAGCNYGNPAYGDGGFFSPYDNPKITDGPKGEYLTDRLTDESIKFIKDNSDNPFFLYLSYYTVHTPMQAKEHVIAKYAAKAKRLGLDKKKQLLKDLPWMKTAAGKGDWKERIVQAHVIYAAMVESLDENVGRVINLLGQLGLADDTIIIFMSDNGGLSTSEGSPTSNLPLRAGKGWLYEGGIREPLIVKWPGVVQPGSTSSEPVISTDFYPTMLEMAGLALKPKQHKDGVSVMPLLKGKDKLNRKAIYWHYPHYSNQGGKPGGAVRMGEYKLIEFYEDNRVELYNLRDDIGERNNLAEKLPKKTARLRKMLGKWYKEVDAKMPEQRQ